MARSVTVARSIRRSGSPVSHLVTESGETWSLHFTSEQLTIGALGWTIGSVDRQGRKPLTRRDSQQARTLTFSHQVGPMNPKDHDRGSTATAAVSALMELADSGRKVRLINATPMEAKGWWWAQLAVTVNERLPTQQIKTATLQWTLTEAIEDRPKIGKVPPPPPKPKPHPPTVKKGQADYRVVAGDSLWKIAARKLGSGTRWRELYTLNQKRLNLKPPEMFRGLLTVWIYPGQVLKIPAR